jgi:hypothetical protein
MAPDGESATKTAGGSCEVRTIFPEHRKKLPSLLDQAPTLCPTRIEIQLLTTLRFGTDVATEFARPCITCCSEGYRSTASRNTTRGRKAARAFLCMGGVQERCAL